MIDKDSLVLAHALHGNNIDDLLIMLVPMLLLGIVLGIGYLRGRRK